jgi:acyl-CoA synthetase (NDP forming)
LLHKSDVGGVRVGLPNESEAVNAARELEPSFCEQGIADQVHGDIVQEMAAIEAEFFVGAPHEPLFGRLLGCGGGGNAR